VQFIGPKRFTALPFKFQEFVKLPDIDFVIISHNHYDHLDFSTTQALRNVIWVVPKGMKKWFLSKNVISVVELDWWETFEFSNDVSVTLTPSQHWSKRWLYGDTDDTLWGSHFIHGKNKKIYFSCDTGYNSSVFTETANILGHVDLALIPIGAYDPPWLMKPSHVNPEEAVQVHRDLGALRSVGMHWGTFILSEEPFF